MAWFAALRSLSRRATGEAMLGGEAVLTRLAAIVAADVPGYLRPVEADRKGPFARPTSLRHDLIDPKIALQRGRTLETTGAVQAAPIAAG